VLTQAVDEFGNSDLDFVGHVGGDDFVIVTTPANAEAICGNVVACFDEGIRAFYTPTDVERGGIDAVDRQGRQTFVPLIAISIAVVCMARDEFEHPAQIGQVAADIKQYLKQQGGDGSRYMINRRNRAELLES
jgi:GGDEF domain-containing protein